MATGAIIVSNTGTIAIIMTRTVIGIIIVAGVLLPLLLYLLFLRLEPARPGSPVAKECEYRDP